MGKKYLETKKESLESSILGVWENAVSETVERAKANLDARTKEYKVHQEKLVAARLRRENKKVTKEAVEVDEGTKEEYEKFFNSALKKFKIDSPADLKSDEEKKKFFNYIDKNYTGEKDEDFESRLKETIGIKESFEIGTDEYRDHALNVTPGETDPEWVAARDFKVSSMKEALAKIWSMEEGNNPFIKKEDDDKALTKGGKNGTTMTGKKAAIIDTKPKIKD